MFQSKNKVAQHKKLSVFLEHDLGCLRNCWRCEFLKKAATDWSISVLRRLRPLFGGHIYRCIKACGRQLHL